MPFLKLTMARSTSPIYVNSDNIIAVNAAAPTPGRPVQSDRTEITTTGMTGDENGMRFVYKIFVEEKLDDVVAALSSAGLTL